MDKILIHWPYLCSSLAIIGNYRIKLYPYIRIVLNLFSCERIESIQASFCQVPSDWPNITKSKNRRKERVELQCVQFRIWLSILLKDQGLKESTQSWNFADVNLKKNKFYFNLLNSSFTLFLMYHDKSIQGGSQKFLLRPKESIGPPCI